MSLTIMIIAHDISPSTDGWFILLNSAPIQVQCMYITYHTASTKNRFLGAGLNAVTKGFRHHNQCAEKKGNEATAILIKQKNEISTLWYNDSTVEVWVVE